MKLLLKIMLLLFANLVNGQNHDEWFNQKETQRKYLQQQIAAFKVYSEYARKGYEIAEKGLRTVSNIQDGDLDLHREFLHSMRSVNSAIKFYTRVEDIVVLQERIIKVTKETLKGAKETKVFSKGELEYCSMVIQNLLSSCLDNIQELSDVIEDEKLEMKDDERLKRIDSIFADMQDKAAFSSSFSEELALLAVQRMRELKEVDISKILNGLK
ncbi:MAG: hypothetical protein E6H07_16750 [Bacteroidetes bacterium]|nr:MAG: hypothetical protein E6H07_16750 [Bacteroidota bacterium]